MAENRANILLGGKMKKAILKKISKTHFHLNYCLGVKTVTTTFMIHREKKTFLKNIPRLKESTMSIDK